MNHVQSGHVMFIQLQLFEQDRQKEHLSPGVRSQPEQQRETCHSEKSHQTPLQELHKQEENGVKYLKC